MACSANRYDARLASQTAWASSDGDSTSGSPFLPLPPAADAPRGVEAAVGARFTPRDDVASVGWVESFGPASGGPPRAESPASAESWSWATPVLPGEVALARGGRSVTPPATLHLEDLPHGPEVVEPREGREQTHNASQSEGSDNTNGTRARRPMTFAEACAEILADSISFAPMRFARTTADGYTYERQPLEEYWRVQRQTYPRAQLRSPLTNVPLDDTSLFPNHTIGALAHAQAKHPHTPGKWWPLYELSTGCRIRYPALSNNGWIARGQTPPPPEAEPVPEPPPELDTAPAPATATVQHADGSSDDGSSDDCSGDHGTSDRTYESYSYSDTNRGRAGSRHPRADFSSGTSELATSAPETRGSMTYVPLENLGCYDYQPLATDSSLTAGSGWSSASQHAGTAAERVALLGTPTDNVPLSTVLPVRPGSPVAEGVAFRDVLLLSQLNETIDRHFPPGHPLRPAEQLDPTALNNARRRARRYMAQLPQRLAQAEAEDFLGIRQQADETRRAQRMARQARLRRNQRRYSKKAYNYSRQGWAALAGFHAIAAIPLSMCNPRRGPCASWVSLAFSAAVHLLPPMVTSAAHWTRWSIVSLTENTPWARSARRFADRLEILGYDLGYFLDLFSLTQAPLVRGAGIATDLGLVGLARARGWDTSLLTRFGVAPAMIWAGAMTARAFMHQQLPHAPFRGMWDQPLIDLGLGL